MRSGNNLSNNCKRVHGRQERVRVQVNFISCPLPIMVGPAKTIFTKSERLTVTWAWYERVNLLIDK